MVAIFIVERKRTKDLLMTHVKFWINQEEFEDAKLKGQSETVYRRRTDNIMDKRKSTKGQTTIDKHTYNLGSRSQAHV